MSSTDWDLGGLTDAGGNLGKLVPSGHVLVPGKIWLEDDAIKWEIVGSSRFQKISLSTLNEFVKLWDLDPAAILKFARKWGVLTMQRVGGKITPLYRPCGESKTEGADPIAAWRYFSRRAYAVLNITAALRQGKLGDLADWHVIAADPTKESIKAAIEEHKYGLGFYTLTPTRPNVNLVDQRARSIESEVEMWLASWRRERMHGISDFRVIWDGERWELEVDYHGFLFAALALQLTLSIVGADSLYTCSGCGVPYVREVKRPKPGTANYCPKCSAKGIAQRRAVETYREKKVQALRLDAVGTPPKEIAEKLSTPLSRIKKWLGKEEAVEKKRRKSPKVK